MKLSSHLGLCAVLVLAVFTSSCAMGRKKRKKFVTTTTRTTTSTPVGYVGQYQASPQGYYPVSVPQPAAVSPPVVAPHPVVVPQPTVYPQTPSYSSPYPYGPYAAAYSTPQSAAPQIPPPPIASYPR